MQNANKDIVLPEVDTKERLPGILMYILSLAPSQAMLSELQWECKNLARVFIPCKNTVIISWQPLCIVEQSEKDCLNTPGYIMWNQVETEKKDIQKQVLARCNDADLACEINSRCSEIPPSPLWYFVSVISQSLALRDIEPDSPTAPVKTKRKLFEVCHDHFTSFFHK